MVAKAKSAQARTADAIRDEAVEHFAARSHDAWRRTLLKTNPEQKGKPRLRRRGGVMVDVNQPWSNLHPNAKADNKRAARDAYDAVTKFPNDREAAADYVHRRWMQRNKHDPAQPRALFKPYSQLSKVEKDKDRAHVDAMKSAIAVVKRRRAGKAAPKSRRARPAAQVKVSIDARSWRRIERAAQRLSTETGRPIRPESLLSAGLDAVAALCEAAADDTRA